MSGALGLIAHVVFWAALGIGWFMDELSSNAAVIFVVLWAAGYIASAYLSQGGYLFMSFVAILDIVLVLMVFKGNVRLT